MKVCLINPATDVMISDTLFPPLGLWYVSAALKMAGHDVEIVDMAFGDPIPAAELYGITGTETQSEQVQELIGKVTRAGKVVVGGAMASVAPYRTLGYGCDLVVQGEAEEVIGDIATHDGIIRAHRITDLDKVPFPDRAQAHRYSLAVEGIPAATMMTSRGCPYRCAFCSKPFGYEVIFRSVGNIMAEVREIRDVYGFKAINFVDDTLGIKQGRLLHLSHELGEAGMMWRCLLRGEQVTLEIAKALKLDGCVEVGIGIESGSDRILRNIQKGESTAEIERGIIRLKSAGIRVKGFFIIGLPGEDEESLADTEAFLEQVELDDIDICVLSVYRGSPIWNHPERYNVGWNGKPTYYKAAPSKYQCSVSTSALTAERILEARSHLEGRFKRW